MFAPIQVLRQLFIKTIYRFFAVNPIADHSRCVEKLSEAEVVSFDVFDTLIKRNVSKPADVFLFAQRIYEKRFGSLGFSLQEKRKQAEKQAYEMSGGKEVSLAEIYGYVTGNDILRNRLINAEIDAEIKLAACNYPVKKLFDFAISEGKIVILVSDMYLDKGVVKRILSEAGYFGYSKLFISSEVGRRKSQGDLFPYVVEQCNVHPGDVVHIGDSIKSDCICAIRAGVKSLLIPRELYRSKLSSERIPTSDDDLPTSVIRSSIANLCCGEQYYERFGIEVLGPLLLGLAQYLKEIGEKENIEKVFFLARDGYVLKKAYDILFPDQTTNTIYLYASRRSIGIPSVYSSDDLCDVAPSARHIKVKDFISSFGIDNVIARKIMHESGYSEGDYISTRRDSLEPAFMKMLNLCYSTMRREIESEREALKKYLIQKGVFGKVLIFDLGWAGNIQGYMQRFIRREFDSNFKPIGVFLGVDAGRVRNDIEYRSYLGEKQKTFCLGLLETCFSAPEGSAKQFKLSHGGGCEVCLADYEYDGRPEDAAVRAIQHGAISLIETISRYKEFIDFNFPHEYLFTGFEEVGMHPTSDDIRAFADFCFEDNGVYSPMAAPASLMDYLLHKRSLVRDFSGSKWKIAFLRRLFIIPLPYAQLLSGLKKMDSIKSRGKKK